MANLGLQNNNPGNLKDPATGAFRVFNTPQEGQQALMQDLAIKKSGKSPNIKPGQTIQQFAEKWAPSSDNNIPSDWANNVAKATGATPDTPWDSIPTDQFAKGIQVAEGTSTMPQVKGSETSVSPEIPISSPQLSHEQMIANINAMEQQGAKPDEIQGYLDSLNTTEQPMQEQGGYVTKAQLPSKPTSEVPQEVPAQQPETNLQKAGDVAGGIGNFLFPIAGDVKDIVQGKNKKSMGQVAADLGLSALPFIPGLGEVGEAARGASLLSKASRLATSVPVVHGAIGYGAGTLSNIAQGQSLGEAITPQVSNISSAIIGGASPLARGVISKATGSSMRGIVNDVTPEFTSKAGASKVASGGTSKSFFSGTINTKTDPYTQKIAQTVSDNVPGFDKMGTFSDKVNATRQAVYNMADDLKKSVIENGKDRIYSFKDLSAKLSNVEEPISLKGTPFEKQIKPIKDAAIAMAKKNGGTISSLFDTRKEFDQLVNKTYPNLWDKENAPMRNAITSIRNEMNTFIENSLPKEVGYTDSLTKQSQLFDAIDNMAPKAFKEVGTSRLGRFANENPKIAGILKGGAQAGAAGLVGGGTLAAGNAIFGNK
jgi:hypothetical protein